MSPIAHEEAPRGRDVWRSLDELAETPEFQERLAREFPSTMPEFLDPATRRQFLRVMGASVLLAGATGCVYQPPEAIIPYVEQPPRVTVGTPLQFATAVGLAGYGMGVVVSSREGRPVQIEGNPDHPASLGACDPFMHANLLDLYDPDRSQVVTRNGRVSTWDDFLAALSDIRGKLRDNKGAGLHVLTGAITSPTMTRLLGDMRKAYPEAKFYAHEPSEGNTRAGIKLALGRDAAEVRNLEAADVVVSLDCDFLTFGPSRIADARGFAKRRDKLATGHGGMNRLYACEPAITNTGAMADHRLACRAGRVPALARALAEYVQGESKPGGLSESESAWVARAAGELRRSRGRSLVLIGESQPPAVQALVHALNAQLGNVGKTVSFIEPVASHPSDEDGTLAGLTRAMDSGAVKTLLILGCNPAYTGSSDLEVARKLRKLSTDGATTIHLGTYEDETAKVCQWHLPEMHTFEAWGDVRAFDGTATVQQPLIRPLYATRSGIEVVSEFLGNDNAVGLELVRETWKGHFKDDFENGWRSALHDGVIADSKRPTIDATPKMPNLDDVAKPGTAPSGMELVFQLDATVFDGRFSNNSWMQGLPKPITKLMWDNAAKIAPKTAERLGLKTDQVVELKYKGRTLRAAVWVDPGHHPESVTLSLGYGRTNAGRVGSGQGFNAYALQTNDAPRGGEGLEVVPTSATYALATRQHFQAMDTQHRDPAVRAATLEDFLKHPELEGMEHNKPEEHGLSLYNDHPYDGYKWGMSINLNTCIGCNSCVTACQAENNIPTLGKDQNLAGRDMLWIRVDRYYEGGADDPENVYFQPVPCMHCENAPCEVVCPVNATVHDAEGLNVMVYNRCVGTRYCGNNCPYKVRRFNFLQYSDWNTESLKILYNPEVTVRTRGVMEKCTFCVQRIVNNRIKAEQEGRRLSDGEVRTACQSACPTNAIVFGDLNDREAAVTKLKHDKRDYNLLGDLNTRPRTTYLAKITNPATGEA